MGRDVESMVRDLTESAVDMVRREKRAEVTAAAARNVEEQLLDLLLPPPRPGPRRRRRRRRPPIPSAPRARSCGSSSARGPSTTARWRWRCAEKGFPSFQILSSQGVEEMGVSMKDMLPGLFGGRTRKRRLPLPEARAALLAEEEARLVDPEQVARAGHRARPVLGDPLHRRDRQDRGPRGRPRPRRVARGRAAGHPSHRGGHDRLHQVRRRAHRPHPLHRRRRLPRQQAVGPHPRAAGALPDPRGARAADPGGPRAHPDRAEERAASRSTGRCWPPRAWSSPSPRRPIAEMARFAMQVNAATENIGARRLATILETVLEDLSFEAGDGRRRTVPIDADEVRAPARPRGHGPGPEPLHPMRRAGRPSCVLAAGRRPAASAATRCRPWPARPSR